MKINSENIGYYRIYTLKDNSWYQSTAQVQIFSKILEGT